MQTVPISNRFPRDSTLVPHRQSHYEWADDGTNTIERAVPSQPLAAHASPFSGRGPAKILKSDVRFLVFPELAPCRPIAVSFISFSLCL
jgi:hypothetical protein